MNCFESECVNVISVFNIEMEKLLDLYKRLAA